MAVKKASAGPPVRFGKPEERPASDGKSSSFLSVPKDKMMELKILVEGSKIPSVDQCALWNYFNPSPVWTYIGDDDPSNDLGIKRGYRAFVPVSYTDDKGELKVKLWSIPVGVHKQLSELEELNGGLKGQKIRVKKSGTGLKTKYSIAFTGKRYKISEDVPSEEDILELLGPYTREEIIKVIEDRCEMSFDDVVATVVGKQGGGPVKPKKTKKFETVEIEDTDEEEMEDEEEVEDDDSFSEDEEAASEEKSKRPAVPPKAAPKAVAKTSKPTPPPTKKAPPPKAPVIVTEDEEDDGDVDATTDDDWDTMDEGDIV